MKPVLVTLALAAALVTPMGAAQAQAFSKVQADKSSIGFQYTQMGVKAEGSFKKFAGELNFDPAAPTKARVVLNVDLASIDTGLKEVNDETAGRQWFNTKVFPSAKFESVSVAPAGGNRYTVNGKLTIKGKTQDVTVPASFTPQGNAAVFDGSFTIKRGDFSIGEGPWAAFDVVANDVVVRFRITATR